MCWIVSRIPLVVLLDFLWISYPPVFPMGTVTHSWVGSPMSAVVGIFLARLLPVVVRMTVFPGGFVRHGWAIGWTPVFVHENRRPTSHLLMLGCHMGRLGGRCQFMSTKTGVQLPICQCIATLWVDWLGDWLDAGFRLRKPASNFPFANAWLPYG